MAVVAVSDAGAVGGVGASLVRKRRGRARGVAAVVGAGLRPAATAPPSTQTRCEHKLKLNLWELIVKRG